eukprot:TRINITY_DN232_c0_g1_i1.p1 TRINITY_DN232_c0_g1~~TRINITY_DN232_c0_g1_i1.p1  ORF type:complete len:255 (-),score=52.55 TRINITY_DN232_c0_g1_i1:57-821(-)
MSDLLVDFHTDGSGGDVPDTTSLSVVELVRHTLVVGTVTLNINVISQLVGGQVGGEMLSSALSESTGEEVSSAGSVTKGLGHFLLWLRMAMPKSFGYRARTRYLFARGFRQRGAEHLSTYLTTYKLGDYVDVKGNGAYHKGMPYKFYHGKTGRVWNVTPRAIGVEINKQVGHRIIRKKINVRLEHVKHSTCRQDFLNRVKANEAVKTKAKKEGKKLPKGHFKRLPSLPRKAFTLKKKDTKGFESIAPVKYERLI